MAKMVGLSRKLKLPWLKYTVDLVADGTSESEIKDKLNEYLSYEIESPTVLRKTREILMNIWVYDNPYSSCLKSEAVQLIERYPEYAVSINWCMMLAAYPVFLDMCKLIGKMSEFQDEITLAQLKQKLFDEWGERTTLYHSICIVRNRNGITAENLSYILNRNDIKKSDAYQSGFLEGTTPAYEAYMRLKKSLAASIN